MPSACESLSVAGGGMVTAAQGVMVENFSEFSRKHLIRSAKDVLEAVLKVCLFSPLDYFLTIVVLSLSVKW